LPIGLECVGLLIWPLVHDCKVAGQSCASERKGTSSLEAR
jgi:hypothetical protein